MCVCVYVCVCARVCIHTGLHDKSKARYKRSTMLGLISETPRPVACGEFEWWRATHHINKVCVRQCDVCV
jgi:hypothetical protein